MPATIHPIRTLNRALGGVIAHLHLNSVRQENQRGKPVIVKRRNAFGRMIIPVANGFFRVAGAPIEFWPMLSEWHRWEVKTYRRLNPGFKVKSWKDGVLIEEAVPGESMWTHLKNGTLTRHMLMAAGAELRRAHGMWSDPHQGRWSHGDAAMCNFIFDPIADRARLIDFELVHHLWLPAVERQADDLLAFLLDLIGSASNRRWLVMAMCFVRSYGDREVIAELEKRLVPAIGMGRFWRKVRTNFADSRKVNPRLETLRCALELEYFPLRVQRSARNDVPTSAGLQPTARQAGPADQTPIRVPVESWPVQERYPQRYRASSQPPQSRPPAHPMHRGQET
jgi:hypothetical protein